MLGSVGSRLNVALDKGVGTPENWTPQPTAAGHASRTVEPSVVHGIVRANKLILSLLAFFFFYLHFILANEVM